MKKIIILFFVLVKFPLFAQVGIGVEDPVSGLDIDPKGSAVEAIEDSYIRLEGLERSPDYLRKIVLNQQGDLATIDYDPNNFNLKTIKYVKSKTTISIDKAADVMDDSKENLNLELDIELSLSAHTDNIVFLEYDVPIYIRDYNQKNTTVIGYMGVTLTKMEQVNTLVELDQGSRKITNYENRSSVKDRDFTGVSILGKAVDQISNDTNSEKIVTYKLFGYAEILKEGDKAVQIYFCNGDLNESSLGSGIFNAVIYEKVK